MTDQGHARYDILDTSGTLAKTFRRESRVRLVGAAGRAAGFAPSGSLYEQVLIPPPDMDEGLARYDTATGRFMDTLRLTKRPVVVREYRDAHGRAVRPFAPSTATGAQPGR